MKTIREGDHVEIFVSGRLCLFGEHTDWASEFGLHPGFCLVVGTNQGLRAVARHNDAILIETVVPDALGRSTGRTRRMTSPADPDALRAAAQDEEEFFRYCAGTALQMVRRDDVTGGLELRISAMDLPLGKGVSSSAAVCILVAEAFNEVYGLGLFPHELMRAAFLGERLTGSRCGMMDQACIFGKTPVLLTFQKTGEPRIEPVFPGAGIEMFIVDLAGKKDTMKILESLHEGYPKDQELQEALGAANERIVRRAYSALHGGDGRLLGELMTEAQSLFDERVAPHCPNQFDSPLLHELLDYADIADHVYGGKGVGSQGDGTAQFVARGEADRNAAMEKIGAAFPDMQCFPLTIPAAR